MAAKIGLNRKKMSFWAEILMFNRPANIEHMQNTKTIFKWMINDNKIQEISKYFFGIYM